MIRLLYRSAKATLHESWNSVISHIFSNDVPDEIQFDESCSKEEEMKTREGIASFCRNIKIKIPKLTRK